MLPMCSRAPLLVTPIAHVLAKIAPGTWPALGPVCLAALTSWTELVGHFIALEPSATATGWVYEWVQQVGGMAYAMLSSCALTC